MTAHFGHGPGPLATSTPLESSSVPEPFPEGLSLEELINILLPVQHNDHDRQTVVQIRELSPKCYYEIVFGLLTEKFPGVELEGPLLEVLCFSLESAFQKDADRLYQLYLRKTLRPLLPVSS